MKNNLPKISIITVVFNGENDVENTIVSVLQQSYIDIEYIIIDGLSTDNTLKIINKYISKISLLISEPDNGIYDAMNKGISSAKGDYIIFMNAGDTFFSLNTIHSIFNNNLDISNSDLIYGGHCVNYHNGKKKMISPSPLKNKLFKMPFCHQSLFSRRELHLKYPFILDLKIASDFDFIQNCYKNSYNFHHIDQTVSCVTSGGLSDKNRIITWNEYEIIYNKYYTKNFYSILYYSIQKKLEKVKAYIKKRR